MFTCRYAHLLHGADNLCYTYKGSASTRGIGDALEGTPRTSDPLKVLILRREKKPSARGRQGRGLREELRKKRAEFWETASACAAFHMPVATLLLFLFEPSSLLSNEAARRGR